MNLEQANLLFEHRIVGGESYQWDCYSSEARYLDYEKNSVTASVVFCPNTGVIFEATVLEERNDEYAFRWLNPQWATAFREECKSRDVDPGVVYDRTRWIDLELWTDFEEKARSMWRGEHPDRRVQVPVELSDDEFTRLARLAHERDITINKMVEEILWQEIRRHQKESASE